MPMTSPLAHWQVRALRELGASGPAPLLRNTAVQDAFVYDRAWGVFTCPGGLHRDLMALLFALRNASANPLQLADELGCSIDDLADRFLERPGTAFRSSAGRRTLARSPRHLDEVEVDSFAPVIYLDQAG
jgi:hypothetical protein